MTEVSSSLKTLIIGYGNPGRQDDGLGPAFIDAFPDKSDVIALQSNYQLTVEDALELKNYAQVIFVDASINGNEPFDLTEITATNNSGFGSHSLTPNALIQLCHTLYQHYPIAYILAIRGYEFDEFEEKLSYKANENLQQALSFITNQFYA